MSDLTLEPDVVEDQVRKLNKQADSAGMLGVFLGLPLGAVVGGLPLVAHGPIPSKFGIATLLLGALLAGVVGHMVGSSRAFGYRLRAQVMLGQLRLEQNVQALLAVSERPLPALPAADPTQVEEHEPPRIDEIVEAMMPAAPPADVAPAFEWPPVDVAPLAPVAPVAAPVAVEFEEVPTVGVPEPEPEPVAEPLAVPHLAPAPAWAAEFAEFATPEFTAPVAVPEFTAPVAAPEFTAPVAVPEFTAPVAAPEFTAPVAVPEFTAPVASPEFAAPVAEPAPAWSVPVQEEPTPAPFPAPVAAPAPAPEPQPAPPVWAAPVAAVPEVAPAPAPDQPQPAAAPEAATPPAAPTDLSALSIAEIARLADTGSL